MGTPVFSHAGIICTGKTYKYVVKLTFAKAASLPEPSSLLNSSLEGNVRRAIDIHENEEINEEALKTLNTRSRRAQSHPWALRQKERHPFAR